jgi:uncharacterized protein YcfJ
MVQTMVNKQLVIGGIVGAIAVTALGATAGYRMLDSDNYAEVISVTPVSETLYESREECRDQLVSVQHPTKDPNQITGTVAGAVIGGLVGNQVGDGSGKKVATVGGAVAGGYAGNKVQEGMQERNVDQVSERVCETVQDSREEPAGYEVTYLQDGETKIVHTADDPGKRIRLENGSPVID